MKINFLIATSLVMMLLGCSPSTTTLTESNDEHIDPLSIDQTGITSVGPVVLGGNDDPVLIVNSRRDQGFYKLENVTDETIVFCAFRPGHLLGALIDYIPSEGLSIQGVQSKKYQVFYKNPDGALISLGTVNCGKPLSSEEYSTLKKDITGYWYVESKQDNEVLRWVNHRKADGTYRILYKKYIDGEIVELQIERGVWDFLHGTVYSTATQTIITEQGSFEINPADEHYQDSYWVKYLNAKEMEYEHLKTGTELKAIRVESEFEF